MVSVVRGETTFSEVELLEKACSDRDSLTFKGQDREFSRSAVSRNPGCAVRHIIAIENFLRTMSCKIPTGSAVNGHCLRTSAKTFSLIRSNISGMRIF